MPFRFAITGAAGYIAPRHMRAIQETGNQLIAACDPHDSVGVLDRYAQHNTAFFTDIERFDRHLELLRRKGEGIDYLSICSPNHLHDAHCRLALRLGAHAICEKPLVIKPHNLDALESLATEHNRSIFPILQLREHPAIKELQSSAKAHQNVDLTYITPRGTWYAHSWKADTEKSGGIITNIGIHLIDALVMLYGEPLQYHLHYSSPTTAAGFLSLRRASVRWFLSTDPAITQGNPLRLITVDDQSVHLTGFEDLHTTAYRQILSGRGHSIATTKPSIELAHHLSNATVSTPSTTLQVHPYALKALQNT